MKIVKDRKYETTVIVDRLTKTVIGDTVSFAELSKLTGMPICSTSSVFTSARRIVMNEYSMVFESIRTVGVKRLNDEELATTHSDADVRKSRRHASRSLKKLACVQDFSGMTNHAQLAHTIKASFFGAVAWMARKNRLQDIAHAAAGRSSELPVKETLAAFMGKPGR